MIAPPSDSDASKNYMMREAPTTTETNKSTRSLRASTTNDVVTGGAAAAANIYSKGTTPDMTSIFSIQAQASALPTNEQQQIKRDGLYRQSRQSTGRVSSAK